MLKKRMAMGILAGLLACSFIAGCGGGDKGTSEPPKPKPIAADLKDLPNKDIKAGGRTFKLFALKNNSKVRLENSYGKGMKLAVVGRDMIYANVKDRLVQMQWDKDGLRMLDNNVDALSGNAKISSDGTRGIFYNNKRMRLNYFDSETKRIEEAQGRFNNLVVIPKGNADKALIWMNQGDMRKVELRNGYRVGKDLGTVRKESRSRDADDKDKINIPQSVVADRNGDFYVGGNARIGTQDVGLVSVYDFNGKQKRVIGKEKREDSKAMHNLTDIALTDEYLVVSDSSVDNQQLFIYRKSTGMLLDTVSYKDLTDNKEVDSNIWVNLSNMPDNRVLLSLSRGRKNVDDEFFILQL
ncbi:hypothetical protein [Phascolarctobacterium succinatutens]|uniref:hypothetical protein n=1 Tax=Phascolarctobacterium succinatutens TaxID=626940 RepID=UPI003F80425D